MGNSAVRLRTLVSGNMGGSRMSLADDYNRRLDEKLSVLRQPTSYPERPTRIEVRETHMAWVFLGDRRAYKLKKPVRNEYLDFSTPRARREDSRREVRLNRRLAPDVYLGVAPLCVDARGRMNLAGEGEPIDWLTEMRRLPEDQMLDSLIARGAVDERQIRPAALLLARFYRDSPPVEIEPEEYRDRLARDILDCRW